ncbi:hypothetical protein OL548_03605 [Lysinibacillus sp. MHQ-1]|nr:hypothetical protein OL548_03605 [Lysinibacillus sp. MHQ-1]
MIFKLLRNKKKDMTEKEKELVQLDWTNFEVQAANQISKKE